METGIGNRQVKECRLVKPILVGEFEFLERTQDNHQRHSRFVSLEGTKAIAVVKG
jgi:hypothetical protein